MTGAHRTYPQRVVSDVIFCSAHCDTSRCGMSPQHQRLLESALAEYTQGQLQSSQRVGVNSWRSVRVQDEGLGTCVRDQT